MKLLFSFLLFCLPLFGQAQKLSTTETHLQYIKFPKIKLPAGVKTYSVINSGPPRGTLGVVHMGYMYLDPKMKDKRAMGSGLPFWAWKSQKEELVKDFTVQGLKRVPKDSAPDITVKVRFLTFDSKLKERLKRIEKEKGWQNREIRIYRLPCDVRVVDKKGKVLLHEVISKPNQWERSRILYERPTTRRSANGYELQILERAVPAKIRKMQDVINDNIATQNRLAKVFHIKVERHKNHNYSELHKHINTVMKNLASFNKDRKVNREELAETEKALEKILKSASTENKAKINPKIQAIGYYYIALYYLLDGSFLRADNIGRAAAMSLPRKYVSSAKAIVAAAEVGLARKSIGHLH